MIEDNAKPPVTASKDAGETPGFCRDCLELVATSARQCPACRSPRLLRHAELFDLSIAHIDCDAFYASVEKRDNPALQDKPLIIGGGRRGVVSTCCYLARINGVRSAMPMFKALKLCPDATVLKPNMEKYVAVGREVRAMMLDLTPLVEPLSIDEAFLDLTGTARLHGKAPALVLAGFVQRMEKELGISASIGLSDSKFLAKLASDLDKPRGFSVIGRAEAVSFLATLPVSAIWGVGKAMQDKLAKQGISGIAQLQKLERSHLISRFGSMGERLYHLSRAQDVRKVDPGSVMKSISSETTFNTDISDRAELERILWKQAERVSARAKLKHLAGQTVGLKLKTPQFRTRTRNATLSDPTQLADRIFQAARPLLEKEADGTSFRLLGVGISNLVTVEHDPALDDLDVRTGQRARAELAMDKVRQKFGNEFVGKGLGFDARPQQKAGSNGQVKSARKEGDALNE